MKSIRLLNPERVFLGYPLSRPAGLDEAEQGAFEIAAGSRAGMPLASLFPRGTPNLYGSLGPTTSINDPCGMLSRALLCAAMPMAWRLSCKRAARADTVASPLLVTKVSPGGTRLTVCWLTPRVGHPAISNSASSSSANAYDS